MFDIADVIGLLFVLLLAKLFAKLFNLFPTLLKNFDTLFATLLTVLLFTLLNNFFTPSAKLAFVNIFFAVCVVFCPEVFCDDCCDVLIDVCCFCVVFFAVLTAFFTVLTAFFTVLTTFFTVLTAFFTVFTALFKRFFAALNIPAPPISCISSLPSSLTLPSFICVSNSEVVAVTIFIFPSSFGKYCAPVSFPFTSTPFSPLNTSVNPCAVYSTGFPFLTFGSSTL